MSEPDPPVTFVYANFIGAYPEFAALPEPLLTSYFNRSGLYFANNICNPAYAVGLALFTELMYLVTAHITALSAPKDANGNYSAVGAAPSAIVGRISSASEGSVSVSAELKGSDSPSEAFFTQTPYGFQFWQATAQWRTMQYAPTPFIPPQSSTYPLYPRRLTPFVRRW